MILRLQHSAGLLPRSWSSHRLQFEVLRAKLRSDSAALSPKRVDRSDVSARLATGRLAFRSCPGAVVVLYESVSRCWPGHVSLSILLACEPPLTLWSRFLA